MLLSRLRCFGMSEWFDYAFDGLTLRSLRGVVGLLFSGWVGSKLSFCLRSASLFARFDVWGWRRYGGDIDQILGGVDDLAQTLVEKREAVELQLDVSGCEGGVSEEGEDVCLELCDGFCGVECDPCLACWQWWLGPDPDPAGSAVVHVCASSSFPPPCTLR